MLGTAKEVVTSGDKSIYRSNGAEGSRKRESARPSEGEGDTAQIGSCRRGRSWGKETCIEDGPSEQRPEKKEEDAGLEAEALKRWQKGYAVTLHRLDPRELEKAPGIVVIEGSYYHHPLQVAGKVTGVEISGGSTNLKLRPTGTTSEELLKYHTGHWGTELRCHLCHQGCNREEVADDLVHIQVARPLKAAAEEDPWVKNLEVTEAPGVDADVDEMALLRARAAELAGVPEAPGKGKLQRRGAVKDQIKKRRRERKRKRK